MSVSTWLNLTFGHRVTTSLGYVLERCPEYPGAHRSGYVYAHRLRMARAIGRPLRADEVVHHRNGNRRDNRLRNLALMTRGQHSTLSNKLWPAESRARANAALLAAVRRRVGKGAL